MAALKSPTVAVVVPRLVARLCPAAFSRTSLAFPLVPAHFSGLRPSCDRPAHPSVPASKSGFSTMSPSRVKAVLTADVGLTKPSEGIVPQIAITATESHVTEWKGDVVVIGVFEGGFGKDVNGIFEDSALKKLDDALGGIFGEIVVEEDFTGKAGQTSSARVSGHGFKRVGFVGLGKPKSASSKTWKSLGESIATIAKPAQAKSVAVLIANPPELSSEAKVSAASTVSLGTILGLFEDTRFKAEGKKPLLEKLEIVGLGSGAAFDAKLDQTVKVTGGVILARQLVNAPPNVLLPSVLADEAENLTADYSDVLTVKILDEEACRKLKMGSYLGVSAASTNPPKFIHIQYKPPTGDVKTKLAIVGKGLTFDSGGYNLKTGPGCSIEIMKIDMGGAAAAIGAAKAIAEVKPLGVEVNFIVAACENMIGGGGMRPGDILTASNGKTIEVNNTDAEGRLTLADALVYACNLKVDKIVDLATLTGACIIALGNDIGGMFTPNDALAEELSSASQSAGEKLWRMPMEDSYWEMMKSSIADMVNTGGRPGGSITAALFLKQFVNEDVAWAHLDIAGPVWSNEKKSATGFAVATLLNWVVKQAQS
ncbi:leucyl aminopeptidase [Marchantia polymorpha subsp. ruderalis]|uniref:Cytosol aminopeptidase domain-containing protein n=2 Tax=Marchantia polymorpha TaxID=3197 RepID=A0AAF6B963_MARPO|nr:hypothetical protein MARPO_0174s0005 [Marchantia polymorpha]BBN08546.1 hypothetical protein Mp_4g12430 [Marchantia polymorpha subsp. ruderalis]PTQ28074.1 hypothetical protein MARPO_0174s0005 [Marchantia polymorpha]PTQ28075.1 hypothetical protein MARPO_0174s0005 [Marchantia polymorpha]BBN08547.1 hypothetical protein Mp_4g12430 [Marchantia polymorpha subsp. ruderalis]|eukprot:PTQ28073.1 hypothetical protein MARPO_0174s0005 [Marchantia polymorpha]